MANNGPGPMPRLLRPAIPNQSPNQPPAERAAETAQPSYGEQLWAQYEKYAKEPAPPPAKAQVALRIGVFSTGPATMPAIRRWASCVGLNTLSGPGISMAVASRI
ncbi:hypothetical protein C4K18_2485 [Pseudomonas chlororaphis subsp. aurantiaca]|nr:hypothetical protein C4K18_2485 [Pseudomonas chlororaphis subsp. aurantiaca]